MQSYVINTLKIVSSTFSIPANCSGISQGQNDVDGVYTRFWFPDDDMSGLDLEALNNEYAAHKWGQFLFADDGVDVIITILTDVINITPVVDGITMPQIQSVNGVAQVVVTPTGSFTFDIAELDTEVHSYER
jgi:hypothetical protein